MLPPRSSRRNAKTDARPISHAVPSPKAVGRLLVRLFGCEGNDRFFESGILSNWIPNGIVPQTRSAELSAAGGLVDQFLNRFEGKIGVTEMSVDLSEVKDEVVFLRQTGCFAGSFHRFGVLTKAGENERFVPIEIGIVGV